MERCSGAGLHVERLPPVLLPQHGHSYRLEVHPGLPHSRSLRWRDLSAVVLSHEHVSGSHERATLGGYLQFSQII